MIAALMRRWPRCKPYDSKLRLCRRHPVWNGRCLKHVQRASEKGEAL